MDIKLYILYFVKCFTIKEERESSREYMANTCTKKAFVRMPEHLFITFVMFTKKTHYYVIFFLVLGLIGGFSYSPLTEYILDFVHHDPANAPLILSFFEVSLIFLLSFYAFYLAKNIHIPSFVIAIFLGIAAKPYLETIIHAHDGNTLNALVAIGATLILF